MFSGIIHTLATIHAMHPTSGGMQMTITPNTPTQNNNSITKTMLSSTYLKKNFVLGSSHAVMGVCLTLVAKKHNAYSFDISQETLDTTNLRYKKIGNTVNLEPALCIGDAIDGHMVSGHVDACGTIQNITSKGDNYCVEITFPLHLEPYIARKGSICVDGVSLTINYVKNNFFEVNIIPHTWHNTCFIQYTLNTLVNLEIDMLARYTQRILSLQST